MIRLVCIDVDGTLVGASGVVHPAIWDAARQVRATGIHLSLSSGRAAFGVARSYAERLDPDGWHCFQNGASIVHLANGRAKSAELPPDLTAALIAEARRNDRLLELYSDGDYVVESTSAWARAHADLLGVPFAARAFESLRGAAVRAQWLLSQTEAEQAIAERRPELEASRSTSPMMPDTHFVSLTRAGINKASAVRTVADEYDIPLEDVMFVGDARNDLSAMRVVGHPVAMGNAHPEVHAVARRSVGDVDEGGLVEALELAMAGR